LKERLVQLLERACPRSGPKNTELSDANSAAIETCGRLAREAPSTQARAAFAPMKNQIEYLVKGRVMACPQP
jgi:hypothetical protein